MYWLNAPATAPPLHQTGVSEGTSVIEQNMKAKGIRNSATVTDDRCYRGIKLRKPFAFLQVSRIQILRAMGQKAEPRHPQCKVDAPQPMVLEHLPNLMEEDTCLGLARLLDIHSLLSSGPEEDFALGEDGSQSGSKR